MHCNCFSGCSLSIYLIDQLGRRSLLISSGIGMCIFHAITAWSFYNTETIQRNLSLSDEVCNNLCDSNNTSATHDQQRDDGSTYVPLIGLVGFYLMFAIGCGSVPVVILGEVFPNSIKGIAVSVINCSMWILNFGMTKTFFLMNNALGISGTFIFFSSSSIVMSFYVFLFLPETKNKTLLQIQQEIQSENKS